MNAHELYTVGHSNRTLPALMELLRAAAIQTVVDVRARPGSARLPQFHGEALRAGVEQAGMAYHWAGRQLGGRRSSRPKSVHVALHDEGLRGYADFMDTEEFQRGAAQLMRLSAKNPTAILCAERLPEHCHRSLISDYLVLQGVRVVHLLDADESCEHQLRPEARRESARLVYDRQVTGTLDL